MIMMNNFKNEPIELRKAMLNAVGRILDSGWYVLGPAVKKFEQRWAQECGVQYGVGVGNGMDAIEIALRTLEIGPGDEVITTSMTAFATVLAIHRAGAIPVLADIDPDTALLSLESAQRCLTPQTKGVVLVHLYGQIADMYAWVDWCTKVGIALIEDCAQAHLATWQGQPAGSFGQISAFSFYPTKNLGAIGDAGMLITRDESLANKAYCLRNYGQSSRGCHTELGLNSRMDELQAELLMIRMSWLEEFIYARRAIAQTYQDRMHHPLVKMMRMPDELSFHVYHLFVVTCEDRDALQAHLLKCGVQTLIHYPIPIHLQKPCSDLRCDPQGLMNTERHAKTCLSLPCHPQMKFNEIMSVITSVNSF
ncbi:MAG: DegT/DnrJ/EryC1/StrS family aminotransferase [Magnetococcus sp. YQC-5]